MLIIPIVDASTCLPLANECNLFQNFEWFRHNGYTDERYSSGRKFLLEVPLRFEHYTEIG